MTMNVPAVSGCLTSKNKNKIVKYLRRVFLFTPGYTTVILEA